MDTKTKTYFNLSIVFGFLSALFFFLMHNDGFFAFFVFPSCYLSALFSYLYRQQRMLNDEEYRIKVEEKQYLSKKRTVEEKTQILNDFLTQNNFIVSKELSFSNRKSFFHKILVDDVNRQFAYINGLKFNVYQFSDLMSYVCFEKYDRRPRRATEELESRTFSINFNDLQIKPIEIVLYVSFGNAYKHVELVSILEYIQNYNNNNQKN